MKTQQIYIRKIGNKTWQKYYSSPVTEEEAKEVQKNYLKVDKFGNEYELKIVDCITKRIW